MISYADFEFAIARWKARMLGMPAPVGATVSGMVESAVPVATSPDNGEPSGISSRPHATVSGSIVVSDSLMEPPKE
jgi:hypothetical protein